MNYSSSKDAIAAPSLKQEDAHFGAERALARAERSKTLAGKINPASCAALAITTRVCYNCKRGVGNEAPARTSLPERRLHVLFQRLKVFALSREEDPATVLHPAVIAGISDVAVCHSTTSFLAHAAWWLPLQQQRSLLYGERCFVIVPFRSKLIGVGLLPTDGHIKKRHCDFYIAVPFVITDFPGNPSRRNEWNLPAFAPEGLRQTLPEG